jgi:asparagine synthase (glutamine-hydrolysing)
LREELRSKGHRFVTNSDTEVVIHAYDQWGPNCVEKFRGMFAFALADFHRRKFLLARDHFGIKPMYYRVGDGYLAFASEITALRRVDDEVPAGNLAAVELYLRFQYIPTPHTIYRDVYKLPPASYLVTDFDGRRGEPVKYWDIKFKPNRWKSDDAWEEEADATIRDSVKAHLVADVPFGCFLSGGVDSSLVALNMSRLLDRPVQAFAIGFKERGYSELEFAEQVARRCGIQLHTAVIEDNSLEFLPELIAHYGEPFGDSSAIPTWHVSRLARERVPMVLSGDGGDEAFAGYAGYDHWVRHHPQAKAYGLLRMATRGSFYLARRAFRERLKAGTWHDLGRWQETNTFVGFDHRTKLWRPQYAGLVELKSDVFEQAAVRARHTDCIAYAQYLDYQTYLPCDILTKVDVASMYHGLEVRTPLIDVRVVELASRLPMDQRFRTNGSPSAIRKYLLKKVLERTFPPEFVHREKQGFAIPRHLWFLPGASQRKMLEDVLLAEGSRLHEFFNPEQLRAEVDVHAPEFDNSNTLWVLLVLGIWLAQNPEVTFN